MMIRRIALYAVLVASVAAPAFGQRATTTTAPKGGQQTTGCSLYQVNTALLNISKDPRPDSNFKDVIENGDLVCVSRSQRVGDREWGYIEYRMRSATER